MSKRRLAWLVSAALALLAGCEAVERAEITAGVSRALARQRARVLSNVRYNLRLDVPDSLAEPILGRARARFRLNDRRRPVVLDFQPGGDHVAAVRVGGVEVGYEAVAEHIVIPASYLRRGENEVEIEFRAGESSLNRHRDYLYTLFVPDRARFAIPCFDQPDLKARFTLTLSLPGGWEALTNAPLRSRSSSDGRSVFVFEETKPISTYLFAFVAGRFQVVTGERGGRRMRMLHRETDTTRVARNTEAIFDLHQRALEWLEEYTGLRYPFEKFDFALIPAFQYSGMEHPGAVFYRASRLLLDESATQNDELRRASVIAHETAHMWFGDLVTMKWFDDVWMKEVFANFMAAKIVNPAFPDIDHDLRFLLAHHPAAYEVDRTAGANPIRQRLDNLDQAGTLYGAIIYQKAPVVVKQLEELMGEEPLRDGLREYLRAFRFGNASWPDLIERLDARTDEDLRAWSRAWVEEAGRPTISTELALDEEGKIASLTLRQSDPQGRGRLWNQRLDVTLAYPHRSLEVALPVRARSATVTGVKGLPAPDFILPNGRGVAYGQFELDSPSREYLLQNLPSLPRALTRGAAWLDLWDAMLEGQVTPERLLALALVALPAERDEQMVQRILSYLETCYWRYLSAGLRTQWSAKVEGLLWNLMEGATASTLKAAYFRAYRSLAVSEEAVRRLEDLWSGKRSLAGLTLSEPDYTRLAQELAVREVEGWDGILDRQAQRIRNPDRRARFEFVRPALSADPVERDRFFQSLRDPRNRMHEPWVLEALRYLHHPLRAASAEKYILPSLELLEEIQATGDIFFPKGWLDATLRGHSSPAAAAVVRRFLGEHPRYPPRLRAKILQSADPLFRAARLMGHEGTGPARN